MSSRPAAIVTGAARGIGRAIAVSLAARGFDLALVDLPGSDATEALSEIAGRGGKAIHIAGDIADAASHAAIVTQTLDAFGRIDCLVNNAGMGAAVRGDLLDLKPENFDRIVSVNLRGTMFLTQEVARWMVAHPGTAPRTIVTITSVSAELASPERIDYCVSKAGLAMWVKGLALRLAAENIAVFDVRPGVIRTDMTAKVAARYEQRIADGLVPAGRWGEAQDVANVVASLASGDFAFATGSVIHADGGLAIPRL
jgi:NAD(P)-dependent dehydrogenase (short-subunit alcohol dehydrogenase family)